MRKLSPITSQGLIREFRDYRRRSENLNRGLIAVMPMELESYTLEQVSLAVAQCGLPLEWTGYVIMILWHRTQRGTSTLQEALDAFKRASGFSD